MICKLCIFQTIGKLWSNHIWRHFWFLHWQKLYLQPLATLEFFSSGLLIMQIWSINYYILTRYTNIGRYLALTYIERFISTIWCFLAIFLVSKFSNFFLPCAETEARFIFQGFNIVLYGKFISDSPILFLFFLSGL